MRSPLPRLRPGIDALPSPWPERPGLLLYDRLRYTDVQLLIPIQWLSILQAMESPDGPTPPVPWAAVESVVQTLRSEGFLDTEEYYALRDACQARFRDSAIRLPSFSQPYTAETLSEHLPTPPSPLPPPPCGIAAPHVSPEGGWLSYAKAYERVALAPADRTFVILGTSHMGAPEKFGVTAKPYQTHFGTSEVDREILDKLVRRSPSCVIEEDYCHAMEHSIEFQVMFLQYVMKHPVKILPILCGPFADSLTQGRAPESPFFDALGDLASEYGDRLFWVLGIDMAHRGVRYGQNFEATADEGRMVEVSTRDHARLERVCASDAAGFADLVTPNHDDLNWCGYSALYTFLRVKPGVTGKLLSYEQWNIDPQSVVSFGALEF